MQDLTQYDTFNLLLCLGVIANVLQSYLNVRIHAELRYVVEKQKKNKSSANKSRKLLKFQHV